MNNNRDLVLTRDIAATAAQLFRCWTEPALIQRWFCPPPWTVSRAETDVRPGGSSLIVMNGPNGEVHPHPGVYLEVVPDKRLVVTDAYTSAWEPSAKPFITIVLSFDAIEGDSEGRTRYTALVRHWTVEDREAHEEMGFHQGWGICTDQLAALSPTV